MKIKEKPLKIHFAMPAKHTTDSNHLDFSVPQIWLQKQKVNQEAAQREIITESQPITQRNQTKTLTSNRIHYSTATTWLD